VVCFSDTKISISVPERIAVPLAYDPLGVIETRYESAHRFMSGYSFTNVFRAGEPLPVNTVSRVKISKR
jgi:hypothetical protein